MTGGTPISTLRNLGPATEEAFRRAGIPDAETLRNLGADAAYACMLTNGERPHFIGYYVLVMALQGRPWNDCKGAEKAALRKRFDSIKAETASRKGQADGISPALATALDALGVIPRARPPG